jgi:hypothetical protein
VTFPGGDAIANGSSDLIATSIQVEIKVIVQSLRDIMNEATISSGILPSLAGLLKCSSFGHESHGDLGESLRRLHTVLHSGPVRMKLAVIMTLDLRAVPSRTHFDLVYERGCQKL